MNILFFIGYLGFVTLFFFVHLPMNYQLSAKIVLRRNPRWLLDHPDVLSKVKGRKLATRVSYIFGVAFIALLGLAIVSDKTPSMLTAIFLLAGFVIVIATVVEIRSVDRFYRLIPPTDAREVDLLRKRLSDYVPMPLVYVPVAILVLFLIAYVHGFLTEIIPYHLAVGRIGGIILMFLMMVYAYQMLFRRPGYHKVPMGIQQIESYVFIATLFLAVLVMLWRIANDFFGAFLGQDIYLFLGLSIALQFAPFLNFLRDDVRHLAEQKADDILNA